ncbi:MAG TPA: undecaprenyldiphospho-muramoylpentapeptide beta-N-acetylglucosaminyltransferase [Firmicutes bacterium]|nr:undecaprenyldiphospho-muramoylpentapeptide beta-N-acetylglucosaminyltransferase [Bacillota bacterium]
MNRSSSTEKRIIIAAGGSGGHIFPALAVWGAISRNHPEYKLTWVGSSHKMESSLIPSRGIQFIGLRQTELRRKPTLSNFLYNIRTLWFLVSSVFHSIGILRKLKPKFVLSTGGFAAGAIGIAAEMTRVPLIIVEPNAYPGMTNRYLGRKASAVFIAYDETKRHFPPEKTHMVGIPARREVVEKDRLQARMELGLDNDTLFILAMGGSQGAAGINRILPDAVSLLTNERPDLNFKILHQCGREKSGNLKINEKLTKDEKYEVAEFIDDIPLYLAAADIVVSRAGASTLTEIASRGLPAILIPYPHSAENHQVKNAKSWENGKAAICIEEKNLSPETLMRSLLILIKDPSKRAEMGKSAMKFGNPLAGEKIADIIQSLIEDQ